MTTQDLLAKIDEYAEAKVRAVIVKLHLVAINELRQKQLDDREARAKRELCEALEVLKGDTP